MFPLLASLILIYMRLDIGLVKVGQGQRIVVHLPFSVYLIWITIATIADVSATLLFLKLEWVGVTAETWAEIIILVATIIAALVAVARRDHCLRARDHLALRRHSGESVFEPEHFMDNSCAPSGPVGGHPCRHSPRLEESDK
jgi:hypothetical protein